MTIRIRHHRRRRKHITPQKKDKRHEEDKQKNPPPDIVFSETFLVSLYTYIDAAISKENSASFTVPDPSKD